MRIALALLLAAALAACDYDPRGRCATSAECPRGLACSGGVCAAPAPAPANLPPAAAADAYALPADGLVECPAASGVLANDSDPEGDPLEAERASGPAHGVVFLEPSGAFRYLRTEAGWTGGDAFTYRASDGALRSAATTVTLTPAP